MTSSAPVEFRTLAGRAERAAREVTSVPAAAFAAPNSPHATEGGPGAPMRRTFMLLGLAVVVGGLYALGALLPFWFLASPSSGAAFFPPAGITLAALLLTPRRTWPLWLAAAMIAELAVDLTHGLPLDLSIGFGLANTLEPLVGALASQWLVERYGGSVRAMLGSYVLGGVLLGPVVGATIAVTASDLFGSGAAEWGRWWLGDALGVLVVATPVLAWARRARFEPNASLLEIGAISALSAAVLLVPAVLWQAPMLVLVLPCLIWAALRGGARAVTTAGFAVAFSAAWIAVTGRADSVLSADMVDDHLVFVQLYLGTTLLAALLLCVEIERRLETEAVLRLTERERALAEVSALAAAAGERHRIARETHDIIGHAMNVMLLQAGAARRFLDRDPERTRELLEGLEETGRDAFRDLDIALGLSDRSPVAADYGLDAVPQLVETMRAAGLAIDLDFDADAEKSATLVEWSAYRILQEALTNVAKHAPAAHVQVSVRSEAGTLFLSIVNTNGRGGAAVSNGRGAANGNGRAERDGRGLIGMRERVAVLGGEMYAGPSAGGFTVRVRLPLQGTRT
jgi:signal transduction histidine kinase